MPLGLEKKIVLNVHETGKWFLITIYEDNSFLINKGIGNIEKVIGDEIGNGTFKPKINNIQFSYKHDEVTKKIADAIAATIADEM